MTAMICESKLFRLRGMNPTGDQRGRPHGWGTTPGRLYGSTTARMQKVERLRRQSRGGTTSGMGTVRLHGSNRYDPMDGGGRVAPGAATESRAWSRDRELSLERKARATHDYMDVEGRIASGTAIEDAEAEGGGTPPWMEKVENVGNTFSSECLEHILEHVLKVEQCR